MLASGLSPPSELGCLPLSRLRVCSSGASCSCGRRASLASLPPHVSARALWSLACSLPAVLLPIAHILLVLRVVNIRRTAAVPPAPPRHILAPFPSCSAFWKTTEDILVGSIYLN
ncbi:hypothetical protein HN51_044560 [Arachis hypogaea]